MRHTASRSAAQWQTIKLSPPATWSTVPGGPVDKLLLSPLSHSVFATLTLSIRFVLLVLRSFFAKHICTSALAERVILSNVQPEMSRCASGDNFNYWKLVSVFCAFIGARKVDAVNYACAPERRQRAGTAIMLIFGPFGVRPAKATNR